MVRVSVMYPTTDDGQFDMEYYKTTHANLIKERFNDPGFIRFEIDQGFGGAKPGSPPPYTVVGHLVFADKPAFQQLMGAHAREINADVPNFTNIRPEVQISEIVA